MESVSSFNCYKWGRHAIGVFYVFLVVILWVSSSELTQSIFENKDFNHPFFLTYFSTALFMIYAPFFTRLYINQCTNYYNGNSTDSSLYQSLSPSNSNSNSNSYSSLSNKKNKKQQQQQEPSIECVEYISSNHNNDIHNINDITDDSDQDDMDDMDDMDNMDDIIIKANQKKIWYDSICIASLNRDKKLSLIETFKLSAIFCPIWFAMNYTFNISLNLTSVASNTILSTMSGPFSLLLSKCLLSTKISFYNISGVLVTLLGSFFIGYLDDKNNDNNGTLIGDILALISAFIYGCYVTLIKYKIKNESSVNMFLFFGLLGFINVCCLWPFLIILNLLKFELFVWPQSDILLLLILNGLISVGSDYFWAQSILYTSPVVATVGLSMMMPIAMIADEIFRNQHHSILYWSGSLFVMLGFILVNLDFKKQQQQQDHHKIDDDDQTQQQQDIDNKPKLSMQQT